jgi:hypothetical protein
MKQPLRPRGKSMDDELQKLDLSSAVPLSKLQRPGTPPPKVYPALNTKLRIVMWISLLGGPLAIAMGGYETYRASQLKTIGKQVTGKLFDSETLDTGQGRTSYQIVVDYLPPGSDTKYRKRFVVSEGDFKQAEATGESTVTYLPSDPTFSAIGEPTSQASEMLAIGVGVLLFGCAIKWYFYRQWKAVEQYVRQDVANS